MQHEMMNTSRREFLSGAAAFGLGGWRLFAAPSGWKHGGKPNLVFGVLSDTHFRTDSFWRRGTFVFNPQTTFLHTGMTYVGADATAVVKPDVGYTNSAITVAGTLCLEGGIVSKKVSVADGGIVENPGAATLSGGIVLANGAKMRLPITDDGEVKMSQCAITPPSDGLATIELSCSSRNVLRNVPITLTQGAKLSADVADRFTVKAAYNGVEIAKDSVPLLSVVNGELTVLFRNIGTVLIVR